MESISFFGDERKILDRQIDVLDYFHDPAFGELGKAFKVSVFRGLGQEKPVAVWEFHCEGLRFNGDIDDASLAFDLRKVDSFYNGDDGIFVDEIR